MKGKLRPGGTESFVDYSRNRRLIGRIITWRRAWREARLAALAPTQSEPPFLAAQTVVLALFVAIAIGCAIRFRGKAIGADLA
jgi:hypothetical protein